MKILKLIPLVLVLSPVSFLANSTNIYADIQVTDVAPTQGFIWQRKNKNTMVYPIEFASSRTQGCAVLSFDISAGGKTENVEILHSVPNRQIGIYSRKMLKKWQWVPAAPAGTLAAEKRTLRLDFCMGGESTAQAEQACKRRAQLACS
ncbi:TonB family protein [Rheinheimera texasensis]|uniref:TonB family protein n=1 Tax=Rheinheimera texasensis TaxID=306205 RepID=UPI0032B2BD30